MPNWFYTDANGQKQGPINEQQFVALAAKGVITRETVVENERGKSAPAGRVKGLTFAETKLPETVSPVQTEIYDFASPAFPPLAESDPFFDAALPEEHTPFAATATPRFQARYGVSPYQSAPISVNVNWYHNPIIVGILTICFFPIGLALLWTHPQWKQQTKIIVSCVIGFLIIVGMFSGGEKDNAEKIGLAMNDAPATEAKAAKAKPTMDGFNRIKAGMTCEEVVGIVGDASEIVSEMELLGIKTVMVQWNVPSFPIPGIMHITFQDGRVYMKTQMGLK